MIDAVFLTGTLSQPFAYTAREYDAETGLYYYRARNYDPTLGKFVSADPIGFAASDHNVYTYVENDPFNWTDPSGLATVVYSTLNQRMRAAGDAAVSTISSGIMFLANNINQMLSGA